MSKILLIEDDDIIGEMICMYLSEENFEVQRARDGQQGVVLLNEFNPDLILLDLMLPDFAGTDLCASLRKVTDVPIIIISANSKVNEKIQALTIGADDYMCKPFSMHELKARMIAVLRRFQRSAAAEPAHALFRAEPESVNLLKFDLETRTIVAQGKKQEMTFSEFELMKLFIQNPEKVFSREELINAVRGYDSFVNDRSIDVHITNLRKKLEVDPKEPKHIKTVWGVGYKFLW